MPTKPKKPCRYPGCPALTYGTYCDAHKKQEAARYNSSRDPETAKRYDRRWRKIRALFIDAHPLCEMCLRHGIVKPTEEVHHILPLSQGGTHSTNNLMALCHECHSSITMTEINRSRRG